MLKATRTREWFLESLAAEKRPLAIGWAGEVPGAGMEGKGTNNWRETENLPILSLPFSVLSNHTA